MSRCEFGPVGCRGPNGMCNILCLRSAGLVRFWWVAATSVVGQVLYVCLLIGEGIRQARR